MEKCGLLIFLCLIGDVCRKAEFSPFLETLYQLYAKRVGHFSEIGVVFSSRGVKITVFPELFALRGICVFEKMASVLEIE